MKFAKLALFAGFLTFALAPAQASEPIRIGVIGPFTGGSNAMGISMLQGTKLAADEINKAGGVLGRRLVLIVRDDQANNDRGAQIAEELTDSRTHFRLLTPLASWPLLAGATKGRSWCIRKLIAPNYAGSIGPALFGRGAWDSL